MRSPLALVVLFAAVVMPSMPSSQEPSARVAKLALPHALGAGETVWLEVTLGPLPRGAEVKLEAPSGKLLGTLSPFAVRSGQASGTYVVPIPLEAIVRDSVAVRVSIEYALASRAPTEKEVKALRVTIKARQLR